MNLSQWKSTTDLILSWTQTDNSVWRHWLNESLRN